VTWHLEPSTAEAYLRRSTDDVTAASVEAHVVGCSSCQTLLSTVDPTLDAWLAEVWNGIDDVLDRPRIGVFERALSAIGCTEVTARIVAASSRARWSYIAAVALSVALALGAAHSGRDAAFGLFLLLAPIGPLVATAGAFGRWADPLYPLLGALPTSPWRMALVRTVASVLPAIALTSISIAILGERGWLAVAWLLPALALCVSTLALATWISVESASLVVAVAWLAVPIVVRLHPTELIDTIGGRGQWVAIVLAVAASAVVAFRRDTFEYSVIP
jgi:hypothetical protein